MQGMGAAKRQPEAVIQAAIETAIEAAKSREGKIF